MTQYLEAVLYRALHGLARALSFRAVGRLGAFLGSLAFGIGIRRGVTLDNLAHAFPEKTLLERREIARAAYRNFVSTLLELMWSSGQTADAVREKVLWKNPEVFHAARARGKGVIFYGAHFGPWELLALTAHFMGGVPVAIIVQKQRNRIIDRIVNEDRCRFGNTTIPMGVSVREIVRLLREGKVVAMLGDQSAARESLAVNFFGRPVAVHRGGAAFSLRMGSPILATFGYRNPDGTHHVQMEEVDYAGLAGSMEERIDELTRRLNAILEQRVREHPGQWLWMHKKWKHTPYFQSLEEQEGVAKSGGDV